MFDFAPQGPEPAAVTALRAARALVATPEQWCQWVASLDLRVGGRAHCLNNAIYIGAHGDARPSDSFSEAVSIVRTVVGRVDIVRWNDTDGRTHAEILDALDRAIAYGLTHATQRETVHV